MLYRVLQLIEMNLVVLTQTQAKVYGDFCSMVINRHLSSVEHSHAARDRCYVQREILHLFELNISTRVSLKN